MARFPQLLVAPLLGAAALVQPGGDLAPPRAGLALRWVENISVPIRPGFAQLLTEVPGQLVVTSFEATPFFGRSGVFAIDVVNRTVAGELRELPGSSAIDWPNTAIGVDASVFGFPAVAVGSGFLVPSHTNGGLWVLQASAAGDHLAAPVKITADKVGRLPDSGWFYHQIALVDMDGDGRKDFVTARCQYGVWPWSNKRGELLWLQQPAGGALSGQPWAEHHLADGPDFLFCVRPDSTNATNLALAAPEFIGGRLVYYYTKDGALQSRVLDTESGPGFSCSWVDLNQDGRDDLLVTNHVNQNGSVFAYVFDGDDFATASFKQHVLASGFSAISTKTGSASPGDAIAFSPRTGDPGKKHLMLSGDNSNSAFVMSPVSEEALDWRYSVEKIADFGADVGRPALGDTDGDGFTDVYIPLYDLNKVAHFSFKPTAEVALAGEPSPPATPAVSAEGELVV